MKILAELEYNNTTNITVMTVTSPIRTYTVLEMQSENSILRSIIILTFPDFNMKLVISNKYHLINDINRYNSDKTIGDSQYR